MKYGLVRDIDPEAVSRGHKIGLSGILRRYKVGIQVDDEDQCRSRSVVLLLSSLVEP